MTGKERIRAAFEHREADRLPCFEQSIASDVASAILGREAFTGTTLLHYQEAVAWMRGEEAHAEFEDRLYHDVIAITEALGLDMIHVPWRRNVRPTKQLSEFEFLYGDPDGAHQVWRFNPAAGTFAAVTTSGAATASDGNPDALEPMVAGAEAGEAAAGPYRIPADDWSLRLLRDVGDRWEVCVGGGLSIAMQPVWYLACGLRPDLVGRWLDVQVDRNLRVLAAWAELGAKVVWGGGDLADNSGPTYGPRVFRELVLPRLQRLTAGCRELGLWYVFRTDGNLLPIEDEFFVQSGIAGYGEIDHDAGMSIVDLKPRHGDRLTFWGDVPCGSLLHRGTPAQVREFVARRREVCGTGGGWIVGSSNSIVPGTPPENLVAMFEAAQED